MLFITNNLSSNLPLFVHFFSVILIPTYMIYFNFLYIKVLYFSSRGFLKINKQMNKNKKNNPNFLFQIEQSIVMNLKRALLANNIGIHAFEVNIYYTIIKTYLQENFSKLWSVLHFLIRKAKTHKVEYCNPIHYSTRLLYVTRNIRTKEFW